MPLSQISASAKSLTNHLEACNSHSLSESTSLWGEVLTCRWVTCFQHSCAPNPFSAVPAFQTMPELGTKPAANPCVWTLLQVSNQVRNSFPVSGFQEVVTKRRQFVKHGSFLWRWTPTLRSHRPVCLRLCVTGAQPCKLPIKLPAKATRGSQDYFTFCPVTFFGAFSATQESPDKLCRWTANAAVWPSLMHIWFPAPLCSCVVTKCTKLPP